MKTFDADRPQLQHNFPKSPESVGEPDIVTCPPRKVPAIDAGPDLGRRREAFEVAARHYLRMRSEERLALARWQVIADKVPEGRAKARREQQVVGKVQERLHAAEERLVAIGWRIREDDLPSHAAHCPDVADVAPWRGIGVVVSGQVVQVVPGDDGYAQVVTVAVADIIGLGG